MILILLPLVAEALRLGESRAFVTTNIRLLCFKTAAVGDSETKRADRIVRMVTIQTERIRKTGKCNAVADHKASPDVRSVETIEGLVSIGPIDSPGRLDSDLSIV